MTLTRRDFFRASGAATLAGAVATSAQAAPSLGPQDGMGVLTDVTLCIGCRKCEWACDQEQELTGKPMEFFEDPKVFEQARRMDADAYTVVNRYDTPDAPERASFIKLQCMHCLKPACVSSCLVRALVQNDDGSITYKRGNCIGCRYCMVACPFQVPAYEYDEPLTPQVRKCNMCHEKISSGRGQPACVEICPVNSMTFGKRADVLALAHERLERYPERYVQKVYGEHEVGGTSWLFIAGQEFADLGLLDLPTNAPPQLTEELQHSIFKFGVPPLIVYGLLGALMYAFRHHDHDDETHEDDAGGQAR